MDPGAQRSNWRKSRLRKMLRWLTTLRVVRGFARGTGLTPLMRKVYHCWSAPDGVFRVYVAGVPITLYARTGQELLQLEGALVTERVWSERYALETFLAFLNPGDVAYDVGANFGLYSVALANKVGDNGRVVAFEPLGHTFERLQANIRLNKLANVLCFQKALGSKTERLEMFVDEERPWCSSLLRRSGIGSERVCEVVEVTTGDSMRQAHNLPVPRAVKIDVEGYEYAVIQGLKGTLSDPHCEFVECEVHPQSLPSGTTPAHLINLLRVCGFNRIDIQGRGPEQQVLAYRS